MAQFIINTEVRNARVAQIEKDVREGQVYGFGEKDLAYVGGRFKFDGKRISVSEALEIISESVESAMYEEFELAQKREAQDAAARTRSDEVMDFVEQHGEEMSIAKVAQLMQLSAVRVRRMVEEGKLEYGARGTVKTMGVVAELERRERIERERSAAKAQPKVKAQKTGEAHD